ncbi:MAG: S16 family serine protease [Candidatus Nanosalina sp.]
MAAFTLGLLAAGLIISAIPVVDSLGTPFHGSRSATANVVAVSKEGDRGVVGQVTANIEPGSGKILLSTNPFVQASTQRSAKTAKNVAERLTGVELDDKNIVYSFDMRAQVVGGSSAGAAMTLATIAAIQGKQVPDDFVVTGTIRPDGMIGRVGEVTTKAMAAGRAGLEKFYVPEGQVVKTYYERKVEKDVMFPGLYTRDVEYVRKTYSIATLTERRYNMTTEAVSSIEELYREVYRKK